MGNLPTLRKTSRFSMDHSLRHLIRRQPLFSFVFLGCIGTALPTCSILAQGTPESAQVSPTGVNVIESGGVYPTTANGANHYLDGGASNTYPSFDVLDFSASSYGLSFPVASVSNLTLTLTEAQDSASKAGSVQHLSYRGHCLHCHREQRIAASVPDRQRSQWPRDSTRHVLHAFQHRDLHLRREHNGYHARHIFVDALQRRPIVLHQPA